MKIYSQGDQAIVVSIEKEVSQDLTEDLLALKDYFVAHDYPFITEIVPTESDIMICYDARDMIKHHNINSPFKYMKDLIESIQLEIRHVPSSENVTEIPVVYGGAYGPDLDALLNFYDMDLSSFIKLHTQNNYFVSMMGYSPGFPYLTGMDKRLFVNHTGKEKTFIPAGAVIIEGKKTGINTTDTYGDWLVIGYTPIKLFDPQQEDFTKLKLGDNVQFKAYQPHELDLGGFNPCQS
ncbi:allophanate hydrolase subunit 1 [Staphylococcus arlettae]|uniref:Allophanate hydrolase n=4 Tax=Staphylococcus arlettae TaxID=29378 RepID=A0A380CLY7_9STAP|nr:MULTISPECIES: allophanate hydrolase subunit 1 [Staphylococcus]EJY96739.1 allophanate hydrolase subunit 1 [Staphylococcus arlettae CVD059]ERF49036.1 allophanate hydrolase subunit 1 [Staphylococcus sp. EGD-HP3]MBF0736559.1 allophanate hydrolase subunit 1 [Staphylococcus arlettae]MBK3719137.1 Kinase A inhibitor [Staphylococcus arlettae]MCD8816353.1 allophanate hydrolase subunit 1 [Staphylococcus arlettae]